MAEDLPIYSDSLLRSRAQFADLERLKGADMTSLWDRSDIHIEQMEGASNVHLVRAAVREPSKASLLEIHSIAFRDRHGAGELRRMAARPLYRGHDCPEPQFIDRSLNNFMGWLSAESLSEMHPVERTALVLSRVVDIWPFEFGNMTAAVIFANLFLKQADLAPFFVRSDHLKEFNTVVAQAMSIETQPLVNAIYRTVRKEMESLVRG